MRRHRALVPLSHDHHRALVEARRLRQAADAPPGEHDAAARAFCAFFDDHVIGHVRDEEERVFPLVFEGDADPPDALAQALVEHARLRALRRALGQSLALRRLDPQALRQLADLLEAHVRLEERVLFPEIERRATTSLDEPGEPAAAPGSETPVVDLARPLTGLGPQWGMASRDLNATLIAWPAGFQVAAHVNAERDVLVVVLDGSAAVTLDGVEHAVGAHELVLIPRERERALAAGPAGVRYLSIHLRREPLLPTRRPKAPAP